MKRQITQGAREMSAIFKGKENYVGDRRMSSKVIKKTKGVKKPLVRDLSSQEYHNVLLNDTIIRRNNILFKSIKHEVFTQTTNIVVSSNKDDKRFISKDKISTIAWDHKMVD